jgi:XTP/dITP diphosphohydrolase
MHKTVLAATHNAGKLGEFARILAPHRIEVLPPPDPAALAAVEETGETFAENALIKARAVSGPTGRAALADDSGLCINALGGRPGVHSARYLGEDTPYAQKMAGILGELQSVAPARRTARFVCAVALVTPRAEQVFTGVCEGAIGFAPRGDGGFGYDPIFMVGDKSFAQLSDAQKDAISHRGRALSALCAAIDRLLAYQGGDMAITSAQRSRLKALAQNLDPIAQFGKNELTAAQIKLVDQALLRRELIKCTLLETSPYTAQELSQMLCEAVGATVVQVIGRRFVLYRPNPDRPVIALD